MKSLKSLLIATALTSILLVSACGNNKRNTRDVLGMSRNSPDEFAVVQHPKLSVPKEFYLLPPAQAARQSAKVTADEAARQIVQNGAVGRTSDMTTEENNARAIRVPLEDDAEQAFLSRLGVDKADPSIRTTLGQENWQAEQQKSGLLDALKDKDNPLEQPVVDAAKERERILNNQTEGKPVTEGETPEIDPSNATPLQKIMKHL